MSRFLRQATASQSRALGPFVDDADFKTAETGLTIANTDIKLMANGAASANKNSGGGTHRVNGFYGVTFDATDTATVGELVVSVVVAGALPVFTTFTVLEEAVYDALFAASALGYVANAPVNLEQIAGATVAVDTNTAGQVSFVSGAYVAVNGGTVNANVVQIDGENVESDGAGRIGVDTAEIADRVLGRSLAGGADGGRTVQDALRPLRNKTSISAGTMTVCEEDDSTPAWTAAVATTPGDPLSAIDPT